MDIPASTYLPLVSFSDTTYKKILLESTEDHDLFLICWKAGQSTLIHDHPEGGCWMKVVLGTLEETEYAYPTMLQMGINRLTVGDQGFKQGSILLHTIRALEDSVSLHLYKPPNYRARTYSRDL